MVSYREIAAIQERGEAVALCVIVSVIGSTPRQVGTKMIVFLDGRISGTIGGGELESYVISEALETIEEGEPRLVKYPKSKPSKGDASGRQVEVYVEPILPQAAILVLGLGHVGKAVARLAKFLGFHVVVSDDREGFACPEQVPHADVYHPGPIPKLLEVFEIHSQTYVVMTTRNVEVDVAALPSLLETPAAYIGVIGSKRRWETTRQQLLEAGITEKALSRVISPIGIKIKAETPEEIALSIMAEIVMRHRGGEVGEALD
jgi:xanthine dehydrogenase accessory factor